MRSGRTIVVAIVMLAIGAALAGPGLVWTIVRVGHVINTPTTATPGVTTRQLGSGRWVIYQWSGNRDGFALPVTMTPDEVQITASDGSHIDVVAVDSGSTITRNGGSIYTEVLQFDAPTSDTYQLRFSTRLQGSVIVARPLARTARDLVAPLVVIGFGGMLIFGGIIVLIVGIVTRSQGARRLAAVPPLPGWYPDPSRPGAQRWWDGARWTDQSM